MQIQGKGSPLGLSLQLYHQRGIQCCRNGMQGEKQAVPLTFAAQEFNAKFVYTNIVQNDHRHPSLLQNYANIARSSPHEQVLSTQVNQVLETAQNCAFTSSFNQNIIPRTYAVSSICMAMTTERLPPIRHLLPELWTCTDRIVPETPSFLTAMHDKCQ